MDHFLYYVVGISIPLALLLSVVLGIELYRMFGVAGLYRLPERDLRFVCSLLRFYLPGGKWRILRNPYLLTDDKVAPCRADLIIIGGGGVMILTVEERRGHFSTPPSGNWTLWQDGKGQRIPNRFAEGRQYVSAVNNILMRCGITCPVVSHVVLSDDSAIVDDLYNENVYTGAQLVPYVKKFCKGKALTKQEQMRLREAIAAHHSRCREAFADKYYQEQAAMEAETPADSLETDQTPTE